MVPFSHLAAFALTAVVIVAIPGPSVLFTISRALTVGRRSALATVGGNAVGLLNPKTIVLLVTIMPAYAVPAQGHLPLQMLLLGILLPIAAVLLDSVWALAAGSAREWFAGSPRRMAAIGGTGGLVMIGLGASIAVSGRTD